jgi:hypothetical protein
MIAGVLAAAHVGSARSKIDLELAARSARRQAFRIVERVLETR